MLKLPVRQATISLSLLLACSSRFKPWESLSGSLATTPLGTFTQGLGHAHHTKKRPAAHGGKPVINDIQKLPFLVFDVAQSKSKSILSQGVVERPVLEIFKQSAEDFLCTAASETERERP